MRFSFYFFSFFAWDKFSTIDFILKNMVVRMHKFYIILIYCYKIPLFVDL